MAEQVESVQPLGSAAAVEPVLTTPFEPYAATCMRNAAVTIVAGRRGTGKTTTVLDLVQRLVDAYAQGGTDDVTTVVFHPTGDGYGDLPVRTVLDVNWLEQHMGQRGPESSPLILVLDQVECTGFLQSSMAMRLFTSARYLRMHVVVAVAYVRELSPQLRDDIDVFMLLGDSWDVAVVLRDCFPNADPGLVRDALQTLRRYDALVSVVESGEVLVDRAIPCARYTQSIPAHGSVQTPAHAADCACRD